jgi:hypothetical protein
MNRAVSVFFPLILAFCWAAGQVTGHSSQASPSATPQLIGHGVLFAKVTTPLDSSKLKEDDTIEVEINQLAKLKDGTMLPKGSKLIGRVLRSSARSRGDLQSLLILAFRRLDLPDGKQFLLKGTLQAVFPKPDPAVDSSIAGAATTAAGGGIDGGVGLVTDARSGSDSSSNNHAQPVATPQSVGVQGIDDLHLDKGVLTSQKKHVKLERGTQMIVRVEIFG